MDPKTTPNQSTFQECYQLANNIIHDSMTILQRNDPFQKQLLLEAAFEFNEKLGKLNEETAEILADQSWRDSKN